jgi:hypothetical protein
MHYILYVRTESQSMIQDEAKWACDNKRIINVSKTNKIVSQRPNPRHGLNPNTLAYIDQLNETK